MDCDRCQAKEIPAECWLQVCVGHSACPAGGPAEPDYERLDLCPKCMAALLAQLVKLNKVDGLELVKLARKKG
jgi:hypothetical protein